jgi:hypothetical protein
MRRRDFADVPYEVQGMKKGVVIALCVAVLAIGAGGVWWAGRDRVPAKSAAAAPKAVLSPAQRAERTERIKQFIAHRRQLWREASYIDIRQAAIDGDLVAQRRLSEIYEDCRMLGGSMNRTLLLLSKLAQGSPRFAPTVAAILHDRGRLCVQAEVDLAKNPTAAEYWLHKSAKSGDPVSEMRYFSRSVPKLSQTQYQYFIDKARVSGDPDMIFELSLLLPKLDGRWPDPVQAPAFEGPTAEQAWVLAACRAGYDCARGSRLMNLICLSTLSCAQPSFEGYLSESGSDPAQSAQRQRQLALIENAILAPKAQ